MVTSLPQPASESQNFSYGFPLLMAQPFTLIGILSEVILRINIPWIAIYKASRISSFISLLRGLWPSSGTCHHQAMVGRLIGNLPGHQYRNTNGVGFNAEQFAVILSMYSCLGSTLNLKYSPIFFFPILYCNLWELSSPGMMKKFGPIQIWTLVSTIKFSSFFLCFLLHKYVFAGLCFYDLKWLQGSIGKSLVINPNESLLDQRPNDLKEELHSENILNWITQKLGIYLLFLSCSGDLW